MLTSTAKQTTSVNFGKPPLSFRIADGRQPAIDYDMCTTDGIWVVKMYKRVAESCKVSPSILDRVHPIPRHGITITTQLKELLERNNT